MLGSLEHITLRGSDVPALVEAYRDALGAAVIGDVTPERARLRLANVDVLVVSGQPSGEVIAAFRIQDAEAFRDSLVSTSFGVEGVEEIPGGIVLTFRDPAGNRLQAVRWGGRIEDLVAS